MEEWEGKDDDLDLGSLDLVEEREAMVSLLLEGSEVEVYPRSGPLHLAEELLLLEEMVSWVLEMDPLWGTLYWDPEELLKVSHQKVAQRRFVD